MKRMVKNVRIIDADFVPILDPFFIKSSRKRGKTYEENPSHYGLIPADAPIWEPIRKGTRIWKAGQEVAS